MLDVTFLCMNTTKESITPLFDRLIPLCSVGLDSTSQPAAAAARPHPGEYTLLHHAQDAIIHSI